MIMLHTKDKHCHCFPLPVHHMLRLTGSDGEEPGFVVAGEQLEDDEELRLHIHGCNSFFTKYGSQKDKAS